MDRCLSWIKTLQCLLLTLSPPDKHACLTHGKQLRQCWPLLPHMNLFVCLVQLRSIKLRSSPSLSDFLFLHPHHQSLLLLLPDPIPGSNPGQIIVCPSRRWLLSQPFTSISPSIPHSLQDAFHVHLRRAGAHNHIVGLRCPYAQ